MIRIEDNVLDCQLYCKICVEFVKFIPGLKVEIKSWIFIFQIYIQLLMVKISKN